MGDRYVQLSAMNKYIYGRSRQRETDMSSYLQWFSISMGGATRGETGMSSYLQWLSISVGEATKWETGMSICL